MNPSGIIALKVLGSIVGAVGLVASGAKLATFMKEGTEIIDETVTPTQEQHMDDGSNRYTKLTEIEGTNLFLEYSHMDMKVGDKTVTQNHYIFDYINNETVPHILYIVNTKNKNIRVTEKMPPKEHTGLYKTWILHKFNHQGFEKDLFGYCPPEVIEGEENRVCDHMPEGWTLAQVE